MKTTLHWKVLLKKNKFMNIIASQLVTLLLIIGIVSTNLAQTPALLSPTSQTKFVNPLPVIKDLGLRIDMTTGKPKKLNVQMRETFQDLGLQLPGGPVLTRVWGYQFPDLPTTYPGATIVAMRDVPVQVKWKNKLPGHFLPVDGSLHMAHPPGTNAVDWYAAGNVATVAHLHGGHTESASDGLPEAWFSQNYKETGAYFVKTDYFYNNDQESATLWYHDHALGITRLNVYAGLAGFYLLRDANEMNLINTGVLPSGDYEIEMVIQDRMFDANGQLFWPAYPGDPAYADFITGEGAILPADVFPGGGPTALAEFFGNFILVNGKAWPKLEVEPRKYRFRLLNGSDSRFYILKLDNLADMMIIGTDDGLLEQPVNVNELVFAPGERYDVVIDFSAYKTVQGDPTGDAITMINRGPDEPYGGGTPGIEFDPADPTTTGSIMQFQVTKPLSAVPNATLAVGTTLRDPIAPLVTDAPARQLVLFEGMDEFGRLQPMLGTLVDGSQTWSEPITENPNLGAIEEWEVYNATGDAHPIHLHLVSFQIQNRETFTGFVTPRPQVQHNSLPLPSVLPDFSDPPTDSEILEWRALNYGIGGVLHVTGLNGDATGPLAHENGWKDTFIVLPGQVGRVRAKFDRLGRYVWHCHILSHEDHEMMRPFHVGPMPQNNVRIASNEGRITDNFPNPFNTSTQVRFELKRAQDINFTVFDMTGKMVYDNLDFYPEGKHAIFWDGFDRDGKILQTGVYLYKLQGEDFNESKRLVIER